ncbi:MAG: hypothetical protein P8M11_12290 [Planctomycetota bacterium]|nr:hypothetical protein [Planctomycetota bacterium]
MKNLLISVWTVLLVALTAAQAQSDVLELRSGELLNGRYMGGSQTSIRFEAAGSLRVVATTEIHAPTNDLPPPPAPVAAPAPVPAPAPVAAPAPALAAAPAAAAKTATAGVTVPAGTPLSVRLKDSLDSNRHSSGHRFTAVLEGNLVVGGTTVARKGSPVYGELLGKKKSGRLRGRSEFTVRVTAVSIDGTIVPISSSGCKVVTENTAKRTVGTVARGAAIGGLAKGSKGAKNGAKWGAGAAILTTGNSIFIPAGTLLEFSLTAPLKR